MSKKKISVKLNVGETVFIPILPPAEPENGSVVISEYDPVPNNIPPILIESVVVPGRVTFVPIIILLLLI